MLNKIKMYMVLLTTPYKNSMKDKKILILIKLNKNVCIYIKSTDLNIR